MIQLSTLVLPMCCAAVLTRTFVYHLCLTLVTLACYTIVSVFYTSVKVFYLKYLVKLLLLHNHEQKSWASPEAPNGPGRSCTDPSVSACRDRVRDSLAQSSPMTFVRDCTANSLASPSSLRHPYVWKRVCMCVSKG